MNPKHLKHHIGIVAFLLAALSLPAQLTAQDDDTTAQAGEQTFFETIEVNIVNVDVVVTDKDGNPVTGLTQDDFEIRENGNPVELTNFFAVESGQQRNTQVEPGKVPLLLPGPLPPDQRLSMVVFVDNMNISPPNRNRILRSVHDFLVSTVRPEDRVMIVSYDGDVKIHERLTGDPELLARALDDVTKATARGAFVSMQLRQVLKELDEAALDENSGGFSISNADSQARSAYNAIRVYANERYDSGQRTVAKLKDFVNSLSALDGRKAILYISEGISLRPAEALFDAWMNKYGLMNIAGMPSPTEVLNLDTGRYLNDLAEHAAANRVTFYGIGATSSQAFSPAEAPGLDVNSLASRGGGRAWTPQLESLNAANQFGSLQMVAAATGGFAARTEMNLDRLFERMRRDFDTYYSLAYSPRHQRDGKRHNVEVRLTRADAKGLKVRHRQAYRDKTSEERMTDRTRSALLLEVADNPLGIEVAFGRAEKDDEDKNYVVPMIVKIPMDKLVLLPQEEFHEGRVSIFFGVRDEKGRYSDVQRIPVPIRIPNDKLMQAMNQGAGYNLTMRMRSGKHTVAVSVRDEVGNIESAVSRSYTPGRLVIDTRG